MTNGLPSAFGATPSPQKRGAETAFRPPPPRVGTIVHTAVCAWLVTQVRRLPGSDYRVAARGKLIGSNEWAALLGRAQRVEVPDAKQS